MKAQITIDLDDAGPVVIASSGTYLLSATAAHEILVGVAKQIKSGRLIMSRECGGKVYAPFTVDQVEHLNAFQRDGVMHPFTCPQREEFVPDHPTGSVLLATIAGWVCPTEGCHYTQDWAHNFMANRSSVAS